MAFPLYNQVINVVKEGNFPHHKWELLCPLINTLPENIVEEIYVLILHHAFVEQHKFNTLPYSAKTFDRRGIMVTVSNLPPNLQDIIQAYIYLRVDINGKL